MTEIAKQSIKRIAATVQRALTVDTGNPAVIEFRNFIKARNEQREEQCREQKRIEPEKRETKIEENRQAATQKMIMTQQRQARTTLQQKKKAA